MESLTFDLYLRALPEEVWAPLTDQPQANGGHPSTVSFELTPMGEVTRLHAAHRASRRTGSFARSSLTAGRC